MTCTQLKSQRQMEIHITIGTRKFHLQIQKYANIIYEIDKFLTSHRLNIKYQGVILQMVRRQLQNRQLKSTTQQQMHQIQRQFNRKKQQIKLNQYHVPLTPPRNHETLTPKNYLKQNYSSINNKWHEEDEQHNKSCVNVYEKWKQKQKEKEFSRNTSKNIAVTPKTNKGTIQKQKKIEIHPSSYFYERGIGFNKEKEKNRDQLFHKQYPFVSKQINLTPKQKNELHQRLYSDYKTKESEKMMSRMKQAMKSREDRSGIKKDKYKEKVRERDQKIDKSIAGLLKKGLIQNPYTIQNVSKSPFRKTNV